MSKPASPRLLVLDTATETVHMALATPDGVHARAVDGGARSSVTLLPGLQALVAEAGLAWADIDAVGFGRGPGAFTGLRTACAVAQGLALGLGKPVLALDTLMAVAESARRARADIAQALALPSTEPLWVLQDARMSEVYAAAYRHDPVQGWAQVSSPVLWPLDHLQAQVSEGRVRCAAGSALAAYPAAVQGLVGPADPQAQPGGEALAALALAAWVRGERLDPALALPLYVRDKVAQTTQERRDAAQAVAAGGLAT
jgi:tRNA threonylcarbamoyladenosine biosynthesis protein TsaB